MDNQNQHSAQTEAKNPGNGLAIAGLILGIIACLFAFIPIFGAPMTTLLVLTGMPLSGVALAKSRKVKVDGKGLAIAGLVVQVVAIFIMIFWVITIQQTAEEVTIEESFKQDSGEPSATEPE